MNGDRKALIESINELEKQPDPNKLNNQSGTNEAKSTDCFTNGTSCQNSPTHHNQEDIASINEDAKDDNNVLENNKTPTNMDKPKPDVLQDKVSNGDEATDVLMDSDSLEVNDSKDMLSNKDKDHEEIESLVNDSKDSQETLTNEIKSSIFISKERDTINGLESNQDFEDDLYKYVDDAEDPISSGEPKEEDQDVIHKLNSKESDTGTFKIVTINRYHSDDENSSDCSDSEEEPRAEDIVSFTSGGDDSRDNNRLKTSDVIILENDQIDSRNGTQTPEVHEICSDNSDKDDCVVTAIEKVAKTPKKIKVVKTSPPSSELRRSSRAIKRKKYDVDIEDLDDESDLEEVVLQDPLQSKSRALISNSKTIATLTSKMKNKIVQKKDDTILIIGSSTITKSHNPLATKSKSALSETIYQKITARGTSVTPISVKSIETKNMATQATQATLEPILPTLTDDMFVVEAPSFIVPYVYEKPAAVPFKEFVEKWGKEIEEQKAKAEQELLEKKKAEKAKREQERQEKKERGEEVHESEEDDLDEVKKKKAEKAERKERRRKKKEDDDASWDGSSSEESDDESISDDDSQTKENIATDLKDVVATPPKSDSYFDLRLGKFFMDIGSNLVQQYVQTDLLHQQNKKLQREKKAGHNTKSRQVSIALLTKNLELSRKTNASFTFKQKKCKFCTFKTESELALQHHLETPHMKNNNVYICNFCSVEFTGSPNVLYHMEKVHGVKGRLERAPVLHQCANCPFEDHGKGKLARHLIACAKRFKTETNLAPPVEWEHPAKIPKLTRARAPVSYQAAQFARHPTDGSMSNVRIPIGNALTSPTFRPRIVAPPMRPTGLLIRHATPQPPNFNLVNSKKQSNHAILISPSPRLASPIQPLNTTNAKGVVMCEICDGYIKDLEQLRNHMQWIHKVKIHPKMIYNRPPLNCQKCQFRFFTDQGLERHLLGSHGLVTSAIQEAANKGKDAGRCPVCGRAYQRKLLAHVSRDHNLVLKPAHLSYKCTVCTATFGMYRQFENHVYSAHSVVAKKVIDKKVAAPTKGNANDNAAKQLKANEDITIIPQPVKIAAAKEK